MIRSKTALGAVAVAAGLAMAATACSSGTKSTTPSAATNSQPVKIMVLGSFSQPPFPLKQIKTAAEAAVKRVNDDGGINGTKIELISCDGHFNPNDATKCARQAVDEHVAAVVGTFTIFGDQVLPLLEKARIPDILPSAISHMEVTSDISFPVSSSSTPLAADLLYLKDKNCGTISKAASQNAQSEASYKNYIQPVAQNLKLNTANVVFPPITTDYASVATELKSKGKCVIFSSGAQQTAALYTALEQADADLTKVVIGPVSLPENTLGQLGSKADGTIMLSQFYFPSSGKPAVQQAVTDMQAIDKNVIVDDTSINAYAAVLTFAQAAKKVSGTITGEGVIKVLQTPGTVIDTGLYAPTDFAKDAGFFPPAPRVADSVFHAYVVKDGKYALTETTLDLKGNLGF